MKQLNVVNKNKEVVGSFSLDSALWDSNLSNWNVSLYNRYYLGNKRQGTKKTKSKGEVSGRGAKPHRQKGTGMARSGSLRNPQNRGGGVAFGPTGEENYTINLNKKLKKNIFKSVLQEKINQNSLLVLDKLNLTEYKTKQAQSLLTNLNSQAKNFLVILAQDETDKELKIRAFRNLTNVQVVDSNLVNSFQIINAEQIIATESAFNELTQRLI